MFIVRIIIGIPIVCLLGWLLCDISPTEEYGWFSGIWHGCFFMGNWVRSWFGDALYKAESYTTAYNVFYWIFSILSVLSLISPTPRRDS